MRLLETANVFFLLSMLLVVGLFVLGNFQEFQDTSQVLLLRMLSVMSMLCIASGLCYVVALMIWMIRRRHVMVLRVLYGLIATAVGLIVSVAGGALEAFVRPA
jgi:hypothetical protein